MASNLLLGERQSRYGWVVVGVSTTVSSLAWSVRSTFAAFYVALLGEFAWETRRGSRWLLLELASAPRLLTPGWLAQRPLGRQAPGAGWRVGLGVALALTGRVTTLWQYYLALGILGGAGIACIQIPAAAIVTGGSSVRVARRSASSARAPGSSLRVCVAF